MENRQSPRFPLACWDKASKATHSAVIRLNEKQDVQSNPDRNKSVSTRPKLNVTLKWLLAIDAIVTLPQELMDMTLPEIVPVGQRHHPAHKLVFVPVFCCCIAAFGKDKRRLVFPGSFFRRL